MNITKDQVEEARVRANVALMLLWSAACSENVDVSCSGRDVYIYEEVRPAYDHGPDLRGRVSSRLVPYDAAQDHAFCMVGEYVIARALHDSDGRWDSFGRWAEVAWRAIEIQTNTGYEGVVAAVDAAYAQMADEEVNA